MQDKMLAEVQEWRRGCRGGAGGAGGVRLRAHCELGTGPELVFYFQPLDFCSLLRSQRPDRRPRGSNCHDGRDHGPNVTGMPTRDFWAICTWLMRLVCCRPSCLLLSAPNCHNSRLLQRIAIAFRLFCSHVFCARSLQTLSIAIPPRSMLS